MKNQPLHIRFQNQSNPKSGFDIIDFQKLLQRKDLDHNIFDNHLVEFFIIHFIEVGDGKHSIDFKEYTYSKGTIFSIRKDQVQKFYPNDKVKGCSLLFTNEFLISYFEKQESEKTLQLFNELLGSPKLQLQEKRYSKTLKQIKRIQEEYFEERDDHSLGIIRSELQILIAQLFRIKSKDGALTYDHKYLSDFVKFQRLAEQHIPNKTKVSDYADKMGLSAKSLNKITKNTIHKTAKEFLEEIHLKHINRLLINSRDSIKEIAYKSGFDESSNLYKFFKRHTQLTPEQFRVKNK